MSKRVLPIVLFLSILAAACDEAQPNQTPTEPTSAAVVAPSPSVSASPAEVKYICPQGPRAARQVEAGAEGDFNGNGVICDLYAQRSPSGSGAVLSMDDVPQLPAR